MTMLLSIIYYAFDGIVLTAAEIAATTDGESTILCRGFFNW